MSRDSNSFFPKSTKDLAHINFPKTQILKHGAEQGKEEHGFKRNAGLWNSVFSVASVVQDLGFILGPYFKPNPDAKIHSAQRGFTLLEVLVALAIFAIMSLITSRGVNMVIDTRTAVVSETAYWRELTLAFERMESDLSQIAPRPWTDAGGKIQPPLRSMTSDDASQGLEFIRFDADRAPLHGIYQCQQKRLVLKLFPKPDVAASDQSISHELLKNLSRCEIDFLDDKNQWRPQWSEAASRPRAIRIRLAVEQHLGDYERIFLIP